MAGGAYQWSGDQRREEEDTENKKTKQNKTVTDLVAEVSTDLALVLDAESVQLVQPVRNRLAGVVEGKVLRVPVVFICSQRRRVVLSIRNAVAWVKG